MRFIKTQTYRYSPSYYVTLDNIVCFCVTGLDLGTGTVWRVQAETKQGDTCTLAVFDTQHLARLTLDMLVRAITRTDEAVLQEWDDVSIAYAPEPPTETPADSSGAS